MRTRKTGRIVRVAEAVVTILALILVLVLEIPWFDSVTRWMSAGAKTATVETVIVAVLVVVYFEHRRGTDLIEDIASTLPRRGEDAVFLGSPMDLYPLLFERMALIKTPAQKRLDVIGMTLYTAWPSVEFELAKEYMEGWVIRFAAVGIGVHGPSGVVPNDWFQETQQNLEKIRRASQLPSLLHRRITLEGFAYDFPPAVHGFRLANGDLFYSILRWGADGKLTLDGYTYEFVPAGDVSEGANAMRAVFDSWFVRALRTGP